ncbi:MAG: hypothetical protein NC098_04780 [Lachnoclostridium sp.]|nr:hypothetical protein [Lachnoclostridium sp.]
MKKYFTMLALAAAMTMSAQMPGIPSENLADSLKAVNKELVTINDAVKKNAEDIKAVNECIDATEKAFVAKTDSMTAEASALAARVDDINSTLNAAIEKVNETLGTEIRTTKTEVTTRTGSLLTYGIIAAIVLLLLVVAAYMILRKRIGDGSVDLDTVKEANKQLQEQSVSLDNKLTEVLQQQLAMADTLKKATANSSSEPDHSLELSIANELARIEQNLAFMDPKTKGVSQLKNRAAAISEALKKKGYEIVPMLGQDYKEGMNVEATMEEDDTLEPGKQIIRRVSRPAVLYKGSMIQPAQVVVAFNPED